MSAFVGLMADGCPMLVRTDAILAVAGVPEVDRAKQRTGELEGSILTLVYGVQIVVEETPAEVIETMRRSLQPGVERGETDDTDAPTG